MVTHLHLSASLEDYLEAIHHIMDNKQVVHAKDIADLLKVQKPSVTRALQTLAKKELVNYTPYGTIALTKQGEVAALDVICRHEGIASFLTKVLGVETGRASEAACNGF